MILLSVTISSVVLASFISFQTKWLQKITCLPLTNHIDLDPKLSVFSNPRKKKNTSVHPTKETVNRCSSFRSNKCDRCCRASTRLNQLYKITERDVISIFTIIHHLELVSLISTPKMHLDLPNLFHLSLELFNLFIHLLQHPNVIDFPKSLVLMPSKKTSDWYFRA